MKNNFKIKLMNLLVLFIVLFFSPVKTYAFEYLSRDIQTQANVKTPRKEKTGYKYKTVNGKKYKRLWSYTHSKWIDDSWTLA